MTTPSYRIALIEDDPFIGESLRERLELEGYGVDWYTTLHDARRGLLKHPPQTVIGDIRLPDGNGAQLLPWLKENLARLPATIFITGYGTIDQAVSLLKQGATDYLTKPLDIRQLLSRLDNLRQQARRALPDSASRALGVSAAMQELETTLVRLAEHPEVPILFSGESGVGKEVAARYLRDIQCPDAPFEALNCAAIPDTLIGSELFGHEKGAFTGAERQRPGLFERAGHGIAFLDEIGDMAAELQPVLLRLLQERSFTRLGGKTKQTAACRILFATHRNLKKMVANGSFREDLYYRVNVVQIEIPPLRERRDDIVWLAERFVHRYNQQNPERAKRLSAAASDYLLRQEWPGNVRELQNVIHRSCILSNEEVLRVADFSEPAASGDDRLDHYLKQDERGYIIATLRAHGLRVAETAAALGISRKTLWQKMKKHGIDRKAL